MRKTLTCLLLCGALALGLAACAPGGEAPDSEQTPSQPVETDASLETAPPSEALALPPEPTGPPAADGDLPNRDYQPWQTACMDFLTALRAEEWANESAFAAVNPEDYTEETEKLWRSIMDSSESYSLYDVDKDGVPELFVQFGDSEAAYHTKCYAFQGGEMVQAGEFSSGNSSLYTCPDKNAVLIHYNQTGYASLDEFSLVDGQLIQAEKIFQEGWVEQYTDPSELVPGAERVDRYHTRMGWVGFVPGPRTGPASGVPRLLPVCDWGLGPAPTGGSTEQARAAILAVLNGGEPLCGVSGDGCYGDTGPMTWAEYVQPGAAYPYSHQPFQIARHVWLDMNGDGQEECVLRLEAGRNDAEWSNRGVVVLSEQGGAVYAYYFGFYSEAEFCANGTISNTYSGAVRLSFWKEQCYEYAVLATSAQPVKWLDGAPTG